MARLPAVLAEASEEHAAPIIIAIVAAEMLDNTRTTANKSQAYWQKPCAVENPYVCRGLRGTRHVDHHTSPIIVAIVVPEMFDNTNITTRNEAMTSRLHSNLDIWYDLGSLNTSQFTVASRAEYTTRVAIAETNAQT